MTKPTTHYKRAFDLETAEPILMIKHSLLLVEPSLQNLLQNKKTYSNWFSRLKATVPQTNRQAYTYEYNGQTNNNTLCVGG